MCKCFYVFVKHNQLKTLQHTHLYQFHHKVPSWGLVFILKKRLLFYDCLVSFLRKCDSLLSRTRDFSICQSIHTNPKKHPSLLPIDYWGGVLSLSIKWSQHNADHSPSFTAKVKNGHSCISTPHSCSQHAQGFCHAYWIIEGKCIYETVEVLWHKLLLTMNLVLRGHSSHNASMFSAVQLQILKYVIHKNMYYNIQQNEKMSTHPATCQNP